MHARLTAATHVVRSDCYLKIPRNSGTRRVANLPIVNSHNILYSVKRTEIKTGLPVRMQQIKAVFR